MVANRVGRRCALLAVLVGLSACGVRYSGHAASFPVATLQEEPGWSFVPELRGVRQQSERDCGAAALASVLGYWGLSVERTRLWAQLGNQRASMGQLRELTREHGLEAYVVPATWEDLEHELGERRPVLIGVVQPYGRERLTHYEVVVGIHARNQQVATFDPAHGWRIRDRDALMAEWEPASHVALVVLGAPG